MPSWRSFPGQAETDGSASWTTDHPVGFPQGAQDVFALNGLQ